MAKTIKLLGGGKKYKDRGRVKLQPRPTQTRLKRGDDDLMAELVQEAAPEKRDRGGVKLQPKPRPSGVKRGDNEALRARLSNKTRKKKAAVRKKASIKKKAAGVKEKAVRTKRGRK